MDTDSLFSAKPDPPSAFTNPVENRLSRQVLITISVALGAHFCLLFLMTSLNRRLMISFAIDDFPLLHKVNPLIVATGQFFCSAIFLLPFCATQFCRYFQLSIGGIILVSLPYIASIASSLTITFFFNPPPYHQVRSFAITCAFLIGFFNDHFYSFPDTAIAVGIMIGGTLLTSGRSTEFYFPFLIFGFASSIVSVQYPFGIRGALHTFRRKFVLMAFTLNLCSFLLTLPFTFVVADFRILKDPAFRLWPFLWTLMCSGIVSGILCLTTAVVIYFSSPLHYVTISSVRGSVTILLQAFADPVRRVLTPLTFFGHMICVVCGVMVLLLHLEQLRQKPGVLWTFPGSLWRLMGICD
jgi:hypothetical protein